MRKHLRYALYLLKHKWYVYQFGKGLRLGWFGLLHDNSKFLPNEWFAYADNFYGDRSAPGVKERFDAAWLEHQRRNKHHWQWWVTVDSWGQQRILPMPDRYRREMLADWMGASLAITGRVDVVNWYRKNKATMILNPDTREWIEARLGLNEWHVEQDPPEPPQTGKPTTRAPDLGETYRAVLREKMRSGATLTPEEEADVVHILAADSGWAS